MPETCRHTGCPDAQRCGDTEQCEPDPCAAVACESKQFCREGVCVDACVGLACGAGQRCLDGACVEDPCGGRCLRSELCDPLDGACVEDPCIRVACAAGQACVGGVCRADAPCAHIDCPNGTRCVEDSCTDGTPGVPPDLTGPAPDPAAPDAGPRADAGPTPADSGPFVGADARPVTPPDAGAARDTGNAQNEPAAEGCGCTLSGRGTAVTALWPVALLALRRRRRR